MKKIISALNFTISITMIIIYQWSQNEIRGFIGTKKIFNEYHLNLKNSFLFRQFPFCP